MMLPQLTRSRADIDPVADPDGARTLSERVVARASSMLAPRQSRRSFLVKSAVVGSAIVANPLTYILRPGTAYGALCGTCSDGWTAFCCTINGGRNSCPSGSFVAGWWKADNAAYCCGAARYIIDCNAICPTQCNCRCSGDACDGRRTCCNQFRYVQCHQEIACYGPVVCRVATCTAPWIYDRSCTTSSATDNRTVSHGSNCLTKDCGPPPPPPLSPIEAVYVYTGGAGGFLGSVVLSERATPDGRGRYALYSAPGGIWWTSALGAHEVHGRIYERYSALGRSGGVLGYPLTNEMPRANGRHSQFEKGSIWYVPEFGAREVLGGHDAIYRYYGGPEGPHGWPTAYNQKTPDGLGVVSQFQRGAVYSGWAIGTGEVHGRIYEKYVAMNRTLGPLGYPVTNELSAPGGSTKYNRFERGSIWFDATYRSRAVLGAIDRQYWSMGGTASPLGLPKTDEVAFPDGGKATPFTRGTIYWLSSIGARGVYGPIHGRYEQEGGAMGRLGYPVTSVYAVSSDLLRCDFQHGTISYRRSTGAITVT